MDELCAELAESAANSSTENTTRIVRAWQERWEIGDVGANGNELLHARFVRKYGGLKWLDPDNGFSTRTAHPEMMYFEKKRGKNRYHILACKEGYDFGLTPQVQEDMHDVWDTTTDFYERVIEFYKNDKQVRCYEEHGDCNRESDNE